MLSYVRHKLNMIRYYSAPRRRSMLTIMVDVALVGAIVLAVPATFLADGSIFREHKIIERSGHLSREDEGGVSARVLDPDLPAYARSDIPYGEFHLLLVEREQGWPIRTSFMQPQISLELNLYDQPGSQKGVVLDDDDPLHEAILQALHAGQKQEMASLYKDPEKARFRESAYDDLIDRWQSQSRHTELRLAGWFANIFLWWAMLSGILSLMALGVWVVFMILSHNNTIAASRRKGEGLCIQCGYNLCGLELNARCPECGTEIY